MAPLQNDVLLLPHNRSVYNMLEKMLNYSNKAIIVSAVGTGKAYVTTKYIAEHKERAVIVCPKHSVEKTWKDLIPGIDTITYQYLCRLEPEAVLSLPYTCWVFDEAHHCCAPKWQKNIDVLMENANGRKFLGLTADPIRHTDGGKDVSHELFDDNVVVGLELDEAIEQKILPTFTYVSTVFGLEKAMGEAKEKANTPGPNRFVIAEKIAKLENSLENRYSIHDILDRHMPKGRRKGVVFVDRIDSLSEAMDIMREWAGENANFVAVHSKQPTSKSSDLLDAFQKLNEGWIFAVDMLNEGLHFPGVNTVIMFRHTESPNVFFQQLGRALAANGEDAVIFDFVGNRKSLTATSTTAASAALAKNKTKNPFQNNIILFDYASEALALLDEINDLLSGEWTEEEIMILRRYYPTEGISVAARLPGRTADACRRRAFTLKIHTDLTWTEEEIKILKDYYISEGPAVAGRLPKRTAIACKHKAQLLGLRRTLGAWTPEEIATLVKYYPSESSNITARLPGRNKRACAAKASQLKIKNNHIWTTEEIAILKKYYPIEKSNVAKRIPGKDSQSCRHKANQLGMKSAPRWTKNEISIIKKYYPDEGNSIVTRLPGRSASACVAKAHQLGLKGPSKRWTTEELKTLREFYPTEGSTAFNRLKNRSKGACSKKAQDLGLKYNNKQ